MHVHLLLKVREAYKFQMKHCVCSMTSNLQQNNIFVYTMTNIMRLLGIVYNYSYWRFPPFSHVYMDCLKAHVI